MEKSFTALKVGIGLCALFTAPAYAGWIDAKTGEPIQVEPYKDPLKEMRNYGYKEGHATYHGINLFWDKECGTWRDAATGGEIQVEPYKDPLKDLRNYDFQEGHADYHGLNLFWKPCPPPTGASHAIPPVRTATTPGLHDSAWGQQRSKELFRSKKTTAPAPVSSNKRFQVKLPNPTVDLPHPAPPPAYGTMPNIPARPY